MKKVDPSSKVQAFKCILTLFDIQCHLQNPINSSHKEEKTSCKAWVLKNDLPRSQFSSHYTVIGYYGD